MGRRPRRRQPEVLAASASFRLPEVARLFEELPRAAIVAISRPDAGDITPMLHFYTIEVNYKQFRWRLYKKALQILHLHFALKRHEFLEEFHEKQEQVSHIMDPMDDSTFNNVWMATAKTNTMIYQDVFSCVPNDPIHSRTQFRQSFAHWRDKIGHTTIDLGVAQEKLETYQDSDLKGTDPMERLQLVRGHLVSFPLDIMCEEDLRPYFSESEYYTSQQVFH